MVNENFNFRFERDEYKKYETWCKENGLDGMYSAATTFEITQTAIGSIVTVFANVLVKDELGEISYDKNGEPKRRRIELKLREL